MWTTEYSIETTVAPDATWRAWADVSRWPAVSADFGETLTALVEHAGR
jgi:hypothetical protein